jgi:Fe-S-cluster-containing hydrogenase component 2
VEKMLIIDHEKCTGCRLCELVCSVKHTRVSNPSKSRVSVMKWDMEGFYLPMVCHGLSALSGCPLYGRLSEGRHIPG